MAKLDYMQATGDRANALSDGAKFAARSEFYQDLLDEICLTLPDEIARDRAAKKSYLKWRATTGLGYDVCLYVNLVNHGYGSGYLSEAECGQRLFPMAEKAQASFGSWAELGANFLDAREIVTGGARSEYGSLRAVAG